MSYSSESFNRLLGGSHDFSHGDIETQYSVVHLLQDVEGTFDFSPPVDLNYLGSAIISGSFEVDFYSNVELHIAETLAGMMPNYWALPIEDDARITVSVNQSGSVTAVSGELMAQISTTCVFVKVSRNVRESITERFIDSYNVTSLVPLWARRALRLSQMNALDLYQPSLNFPDMPHSFSHGYGFHANGAYGGFGAIDQMFGSYADFRRYQFHVELMNRIRNATDALMATAGQILALEGPVEDDEENEEYEEEYEEEEEEEHLELFNNVLYRHVAGHPLSDTSILVPIMNSPLELPSISEPLSALLNGRVDPPLEVGLHFDAEHPYIIGLPVPILLPQEVEGEPNYIFVVVQNVLMML